MSYFFRNIFAVKTLPFPESTCNTKFYESLGGIYVDHAVNGFNVTILAYGQTGSGKTYTMGLENKESNGANCGMIPRLVNELFECSNDENHKAEIECTYLELYNDKIFDLLAESEQDLKIREKKTGEIYSERGNRVNYS